MKHHKKQYRRILIGMLLLGSTAAMMHACAWDDSLYQEFVIEDDEGGHLVSCKDVLDKIIIYNDGTMITYNNDGTMITYNSDGMRGESISSEGMFANAFAYNLCPRAAPNCMIEEISDTEAPEVSEDTLQKKFICHNCLANYNVCKGKCVDITNPNLHIHKCGLEKLECDGDYYDFNKDSSDGCEFQLSKNHVINDKGNLVCAEDYFNLNGDLSNDGCEFQLTKNHVSINDEGSLVCANDYFDLNQDLNNKVASDGCEFQLSPVHIDKDKTQPKNPTEPWICVDGYADLDNDRYSGCEINGWTDNDHCGAGVIDGETRKTGRQCEYYEVCTRGECAENCGDENYMLVCGSQCVNTNIDNAHCGGCSATCSITANDTRAAVACQDGGCHAIACQPGHYLADGTDETGKAVKKCEPCAEGEYTTRATDTACIACPTTTGAASMVFDANNNICKAASCSEGYQLKDGSCEPCGPGTYSKKPDDTSCENKDCDMKCTECPDGHFSGHAASSCTKCPAGTYTTDHIQCINCLAGEYSDEGSKECTSCTENTISAAGSAKCAECKGNTHANSDHTACVGCNDDGNAKIECGPTTGAHTMKCENNVCKAATCNNGYKLNDGQCEPCEPGTFLGGWINGVTVNACTACGENNFSGRAALNCTPCPTGTHTVGEDRTTCEALNCESGYHVYVNSCEKDDKDNCGAPGNKCATLNNGTSACTNGQCVYKCHAGYYWKAEGCTDNKCCQPCPAGHYCPTEGLTSPIPCTFGHYCPAKNSTECGTGTACANNHPTACPMGTYRGNISGKSESDCINCPKGMHNDGYGAWACSLIPAGYVGINCRNDSKKEGCTQYSMCFDGNSVTKCSNMYGSNSTCSSGYCMDTTQTTSTSCIADNNGCPAVACCSGACATNNDNCGSCGTKCKGGKTCKDGTCKSSS